MEVSSLQSPQTVAAPRRAAFLRPLWLQSDEGLLSLTRVGNEAAFEHLVRRYRVRLLSFCRQMVRSEQDAEDLLQDTFAAAYGAINGDDREIHVRPWLYRIARNRCLNHLRHVAAAHANGHNGQSLNAIEELPADLSLPVADRVARREQLRHMVQDILRLPETQRTALVLHELHGLSYSDAAAAMDTTVPAVKSLLVRARVSLVEAVEGRELTCDQVRAELAEGAEGVRTVSAAARSHARHCDECKGFKLKLRSTSKTLSALAPVWPLLTLKGLVLGKLGSGTTAAAGGAAVGAGGSAIGVSGGTAALLAKTAVGLATLTALTTGMPEVSRTGQQGSAPAAEVSAPAPATPSAPAGAVPEAPAMQDRPGAGQGAQLVFGESPAVPPPPGRILSSTPDVVTGIEGATHGGRYELRVGSPQAQPAPGAGIRRTRPAPGAPTQAPGPEAGAEAAPPAEQPQGGLLDNLFGGGSDEPPATSEESGGSAQTGASDQQAAATDEPAVTPQG